MRANITVTLVKGRFGNFTGILLTDMTSTVVVNNATPGTADGIFTTTVLPTDTNGNITFSITATNSSGSQLLVTDENITDGSFVTVDTVKPVITLNGNSPDTVFQGERYLDQNGTVSDSNIFLVHTDVTASPGNLSTSLLGPQNITYSAPSDAAGNVPDDVNRTVTVLAKPLGIDTLTIESSNTNNPSYAKIDDLITITLDANGTINSATTTVASNTTTPIKSSIFAYEGLFVLLLSIVNVSIPSGFASTVTVLITSSGTLPAASDGPEYVMVFAPSDDVPSFAVKPMYMRDS